MSARALGVCCGIVVGLIFVILILKLTKTDGSIKCKYDERQMAIRGRGYMYGFFTFMAGNAVYILADIGGVEFPCELSVGLMLVLLLAIFVMATYCIWNEAYFSLNENRKRLMIAFGIIACVNIALGVMYLAGDEMIVQGKLTFRVINLFCGIMMLLLIFVLAAKDWATAKGQEEFEE